MKAIYYNSICNSKTKNNPMPARGRLNKLWFSCPMNYYAAIKRFKDDVEYLLLRVDLLDMLCGRAKCGQSV